VPAYVLGDIHVTDPAQFDTYRTPAGASIAQYGGRMLAATPKAELLDGDSSPELSVVIEFPDAAAALVSVVGIPGGIADPTKILAGPRLPN
jgi:uncharacterized protein (DUF1330 family)